MSGDVEVLAAGIRTRSRALDYLELMKPELTGLSVLTTLCGFYLATERAFDYWLFVHTAIGTLLVGGGAGALNQWIERNYDALMKRTERRPLPAGRLSPAEVASFGIFISIAGIVELSVAANLLTGFLAALTWTTYLFLYTPLKRVTPFSTIVGAVPGAIPPVMGWTAVRNDIGVEAWILFAILFCWQIPHFLSLAWMYRRDYARAGFKMLTVVDAEGTRTSRQIVIFSIILIPAGMMSTLLGMTGLFFGVSSVVLGTLFLIGGIHLYKSSRSIDPEAQPIVNLYARRIFFASLVYLPALMIIMSIDKV